MDLWNGKQKRNVWEVKEGGGKGKGDKEGKE